MLWYVPEAHVINKQEQEILLKLREFKFDPAQWKVIWDVMGFTRVTDVLHINREHITNASMKAMPTQHLSSFIDFLNGKYDAPQAFPPFICPEGRDHCPGVWKRKRIKEWFFNAAWHGCFPCVRYCVEVLHVEPDVESDRMKYKASDWALWAVQHDVPEASRVLDYLNAVVPQVDNGGHVQTQSFCSCRMPSSF